jgi:hypothetical protein
MAVAAIDKPDGITAFAAEGAMLDARRMTTVQLRQLGVPTLVYLRSGLLNGELAYAIHAADGTTIAVVEDIDVAVELVSERGMAFVAVH